VAVSFRYLKKRKKYGGHRYNGDTDFGTSQDKIDNLVSHSLCSWLRVGESGLFLYANPHISPVSWMMALDRCGWAPGWTEDHSRSYGLKEAQVQSYMEKVRPGTGREAGLGHKRGPG